MKTTIWKYKLRPAVLQTVKMPQRSKIICAQMQDSVMCLWAIVYPEKLDEDRIIEIINTGTLMPLAKRRYISTVQLNGGQIIAHVFERLICEDSYIENIDPSIPMAGVEVG